MKLAVTVTDPDKELYLMHETVVQSKRNVSLPKCYYEEKKG